MAAWTTTDNVDGNKIMGALNRKGISAAQAARDIGRSDSLLSDIAKTNRTSKTTFLCLCMTYKLNPEDYILRNDVEKAVEPEVVELKEDQAETLKNMTPPTYGECLEICQSKGFDGRYINGFLRHYGERGWKTAAGEAIDNWQGVLVRWCKRCTEYDAKKFGERFTRPKEQTQRCNPQPEYNASDENFKRLSSAYDNVRKERDDALAELDELRETVSANKAEIARLKTAKDNAVKVANEATLKLSQYTTIADKYMRIKNELRNILIEAERKDTK